MSQRRPPKIWLLTISLIIAVALTAFLLSSASAEPKPGPSIRLVRTTFDPLIDLPDLPADLTLHAYPSGTAGIYLIQFEGPIQTAWKGDMDRLGIRLFDYVPDYAFLAWMDGPSAARAGQHPHVRWVGLYQPAYRLNPRLDGAEGKQTITLLTLPTVDTVTFRTDLESLGASIYSVSLNEFGGYFQLTVDAAQLPALAHLPPVVWVEPFTPPRPINDVARGDGILGVESVWQDLGLYGEGQIVGICDTGLDVGTNDAAMIDDFEGRIIDLYEYPLQLLDGPDDPCKGHGTHVAGSLLGNGVNSGSDPANHNYTGSYAGVAPEAQLVFQAVAWALLPPDNCPMLGLMTGDLNDLFQDAYDYGARIHSNSWGAEVNGEYTAHSQQADQFTWNHKDFTLLFGAGNSGTDADSDGVVDLDNLLSPATAKNAIAVGGSENDRPVPTPNPDSYTYYFVWPDRFPVQPISGDFLADDPIGIFAVSSRGPTDDGRIKPDVVAPATWVLSVYSQANHPEDGGNQYDGSGTPPNRWYKYMGGTSMATPLAAGATTLIRQYFNDVAGLATPSSALVKATLINGAYDMTPGQYGTGAFQEISARPDYAQGWGRVDLANSLMPDPPRGWWYDDHDAGLGTGDAVTYTSSPTTPLTVMDDGEPLRVSLVWTDYPGTPPAGGLVNDLDLEIIDPGGVHHYGNGTAWDRVNNVEGVDILAPTLGHYTIVVRAYNVAQDTQSYALVVSGALGDAGCEPLADVALDAPGLASVGTSVPFTATVAPPTATTPIRYLWDFGDDLSSSGTTPTTDHVYGTAGLYTATVTATNCSGIGQAIDSLQVRIQGGCQLPDNVDFAWGPRPAQVGTVTTFTASVGAATLPLTYTWHFGDDGSRLIEHSGTVTHTFNLSSTFPVTLTVANPCGVAAPVVRQVGVSPAEPRLEIFLPIVLKLS